MSRQDAKRIEVTSRTVKRNPWFQWLGASPFILTGLLGLLALVKWNALFLLPTGHLTIGGLVLNLWLYKRNYRPRLVPTELRADDDTLYIGEKSFPRTSIKNAYLAPGGDHTRVRLVRGRFRSDIEIAVPDWTQGEQVLSALGFGVDQTVGRFRTLSRMRAVAPLKAFAVGVGGLVGMGLLVAILAEIHPSLGIIGMLGFLVAMITVQHAPTRLEVGADGLLTRWLGRERFIDYDDVVSVAEKERGFGNQKHSGVELQLRSGETYRIPVEHKQWSSGETPAIYARIYASLVQHRQRVPVQAQALIQRGELSHIDWVKALQARLEVGAHRRAAISIEALWRTIEDHASRAVDRAAAAVALGEQLDESESARLKRVASTVASPKLRIAIDHVADQDDTEAIAEALGALEEEDAASATD